MFNDVKKTSFKKQFWYVAAAIAFICTPTIASAYGQVQVTLATASGGVWVELSQGGIPIANAVVNKYYTTDEDGRVFVRSGLQKKSNMVLAISVPDSEPLYRTVHLRKS